MSTSPAGMLDAQGPMTIAPPPVTRVWYYGVSLAPGVPNQTFPGYQLAGVGGPVLLCGVGDPTQAGTQASALTPPAGSLYIRQDPGSGTAVYFFSTTWQPVIGGPGTIAITGEVPSGAQNSVNTIYTLAFPPVGGAAVYVQGKRLAVGSNYSLSGATLTVFVPPGPTDNLTVDYRH
jgi:hypothetical protein